MLAIVYFNKTYRHSWENGSNFAPIILHCVWLWKTLELIRQQGRWLERLAEFDFEIVHRPGRKHDNADALLRKPCRQCGECLVQEEIVENREIKEVLNPNMSKNENAIAKAQQECPVLRMVHQWLKEDVRFLV